MKRQFPFYVLHIDMPADLVDVNVHPNKADVRFVDNKFIFGVVYKVVSAVLDGTPSAMDFVADYARVPQIKSTSTAKSENVNKVYAEDEPFVPQEIIDKYKPSQSTIFPEDVKLLDDGPAQPEPEKEDRPFDPERDLSLATFYGADFRYDTTPQDDNLYVGDSALEINPYLEEAKEIEKRYFERKQARIDYETCKYCGALFNTYLMYEYRDTVYIIDQHAAHERILFDKLKNKLKRRKIVKQPLLLPYDFHVNALEFQFMEKNFNVIQDLGFTILHHGLNTYRITEVPADLKDIKINEFFDEVLAQIGSYDEITLEEMLKDKLASTACKHAIKGGEILTEQEVKYLIKLMDGNVALKCPHGRPVCVSLSKTEIEKMFKRIV